METKSKLSIIYPFQDIHRYKYLRLTKHYQCDSDSKEASNSWWKTISPTTRLERHLFLATIVFASGFFIIAIAFMSNNHTYWMGSYKTAKSMVFESTAPYVCTTTGCVKAGMLPFLVTMLTSIVKA
jgi:hypothetical protein